MVHGSGIHGMMLVLSPSLIPQLVPSKLLHRRVFLQVQISFARIRSATSDSILSDWVSVRFLLPDHDVTTEADGTQSFTVKNNSAGYGGTVEETYITSGNTSFNGGSASNLFVGHSNDSNIGEV